MRGLLRDSGDCECFSVEMADRTEDCKKVFSSCNIIRFLKPSFYSFVVFLLFLPFLGCIARSFAGLVEMQIMFISIWNVRCHFGKLCIFDCHMFHFMTFTVLWMSKIHVFWKCFQKSVGKFGLVSRCHKTNLNSFIHKFSCFNDHECIPKK